MPGFSTHSFVALTVLVILGIAPEKTFAKLSDKIVLAGQKSLAHIDDASGSVSTSLTQQTLGAWKSADPFGYGTYEVEIMVPSGYTGAVVTAYFAQAIKGPAQGGLHDEIDFELLGNADCSNYIIHTNYYASGVGSHEEQMKIWFPLCGNFVRFKVVYTNVHIVWLVNDVPIREFVFTSSSAIVAQDLIWHGDVWRAFWASKNAAGALVPVNWAYAPFTAHYRKFNFRRNVASPSTLGRLLAGTKAGRQMKWIRRHYLKYTWTNPTRGNGGGHHPPGKGHHTRKLMSSDLEAATNPMRAIGSVETLPSEEEEKVVV
eukprot:TRINITY_DN76_c0_g1_i1.p1 TRINITY_DN76_c0_g1~~TRINITY_DN76_c0_g1_i1.p1  ORF type:complete len:316 (+),score=44.48 TRINITY_DN76_c0_g1_i1:454-1401(+)